MDVQLVKQHYGKMLGHSDFYARFYENFIHSDPHIGRLFVRADMKAQMQLLRHGVNLLIMFAEGNYAGEVGIHRLSETHSPRRMDISPKLYVHWKTAFFQTLVEFDRNISNELLTAWERVIDLGLERMQRPHQEAALT